MPLVLLLELEISSDVVPTYGAESGIGVLARRDGWGGLQPHDGEGGKIEDGVVLRIDWL